MAKSSTSFKNGNPGKPRGAVSEKTKMWEALGKMITEGGAERALNFLEKVDDETFMKYYLMLLEYFKPKLQRSDITSNEKPQPSPFEGMTYEQLYELKYGRRPDKRGNNA